ncbi:fluoride efflux transporter CrcB [Rhizobium sp. LjRoot258]|uniref:fluoride efflux transporter CrcB n=1 Tax=Rhizobium sp. LjRoot258 TaxID=3342299 RepID=UPI003F503BFC
MTPAIDAPWGEQEAYVEFLLVFLGSGFGGLLRYEVGVLSIRLLGPSFPYGTLAINVVGSALMGFVVAVFATLNFSAQETRLFLTTGIIGGFTTFSTFSLDAVALWERGQYLAAASYVLASVVISLVALTLSMVLVRRLL